MKVRYTTRPPKSARKGLAAWVYFSHRRAGVPIDSLRYVARDREWVCVYQDGVTIDSKDLFESSARESAKSIYRASGLR